MAQQRSQILGPRPWLQVAQPGMETQGKNENPSVSRTPFFLSSPETLKTLGWKLSWGSLKFKARAWGAGCGGTEPAWVLRALLAPGDTD